MQASTRSVIVNATVIMPVVMIVGAVAASFTIDFFIGLTNSAHTQWPVAWIGNFCAPAIAGFASCYALHLLRFKHAPPSASHWTLFAPFDAIATLLLALILIGSRSPDFWLAGQILLWPCVALWAGAFGDLTATWWNGDHPMPASLGR